FSRLFSYTGPSRTEIYPLSLHDALPIWISLQYICWGSAADHSAKFPSHRILQPTTGVSVHSQPCNALRHNNHPTQQHPPAVPLLDRKSTRLNSSHVSISYAVFCLKKKNK